MDKIRVRWEVPHNSEVHRIVVGGRIWLVVVIPRRANVSRRVARGRVHSIAPSLYGKICVGSKSAKVALGCNVEDSLDPCKFIAGSHDT